MTSLDLSRISRAFEARASELFDNLDINGDKQVIWDDSVAAEGESMYDNR